MSDKGGDAPPTPDRIRRWTDLPGFGRRTLVMGVVNVTPDSFSGDGVIVAGANHVDAAIARAEAMIDAGADIIDMGAESTRPGAEPVSQESEQARLIPAIAALAKVTDRPISVDTRNASTAAAALDAGAAVINDVSGLTHDGRMASVAAKRCVPIVIMHNSARGSVKSSALGPRFVEAPYDDVVGAVREALRKLVDRALAAGVAREQICIDPGIGFGKTVEQNLTLLNRLDALADLGYPILLGPSRKSFIGYTLNLPIDDRVEGTAATVAIGIARGAAIMRVHDVKQMVRVARMADAIVRS